jgi:hypothetical protein
MVEGPRYVFNPRYADRLPLRLLKAGELRQVPLLARCGKYRTIRDHLPELGFLTDPTLFPATAHLPEGGAIVGSPLDVRRDAAEPGHEPKRRAMGRVRETHQDM